MTVDNLFVVNEDLIKSVRGIYEKSDYDIKEDLKILKSWYEKQHHLPKVNDDGYLERILMRNKFRIEQCKKKIDAHFTLKGIYSDCFGLKRFDVNSEDVKNVVKFQYMTFLKDPLPNGERVMVYKIRDASDLDIFSFKNLSLYFFAMMEIMNQHDYCVAIRVVCDFTNFKFGIYTKIDPVILFKSMKLIQEGYSCRFAGLEYVNVPSFVDLMVKLVSPVLKDSKIRVHGNMEELFEIVPQEYLPEEFGGSAGKLEDIQQAWYEEVKRQEKFIKERISMVSNEKLRIGKCLYSEEELFGMEGSFKKINLD